MCKPKNQGGRRCAAHTRPAYAAVISNIEAEGEADQSAYVNHMTTVASHASTPAGQLEVEELMGKHRKAKSHSIAGFLEQCLHMANGMRNAYTQAESEVQEALRKSRSN